MTSSKQIWNVNVTSTITSPYLIITSLFSDFIHIILPRQTIQFSRLEENSGSAVIIFGNLFRSSNTMPDTALFVLYFTAGFRTLSSAV